MNTFEGNVVAKDVIRDVNSFERTELTLYFAKIIRRRNRWIKTA